MRAPHADGTWHEHHGGRGEIVALSSLDAELAVDEAYDRSTLTRSP